MKRNQVKMQLRKQIEELKRTPELLNQLDTKMTLYKRVGFIEEVNENVKAEGPVHVIPSLIFFRIDK